MRKKDTFQRVVSLGAVGFFTLVVLGALNLSDLFLSRLGLSEPGESRWGFSGASLAAEGAGGGYEFVADMDTLMYHMEDTFEAAIERSEAKKFKTARRKAMVVAEFGNLFTYVEEHKNNPKWIKYCKDLTSAAKELAGAMKAKDPAQVTAAQTKVEASCEGCHDDIRDA